MVGRFPPGALVLGGLALGLILVFMLLPLGVVVAASLTAGQFLTFPPQGLSFRWYGDVLASEAYLSSAWTSLKVATLVTIAATGVILGAVYMLSYGLVPTGVAIFAIAMAHSLSDGLTFASTGVAVGMASSASGWFRK